MNSEIDEQENSTSARAMYRATAAAEPVQEVRTIDDAIRRTEAALQQIDRSPPLDTLEGGLTQDHRSDPAPSVSAIAEERAQQLLANISSQMLGELRTLREQIDGLMGDMIERRDLISEAIRSHAEFAETAIQHKIIIAESVAKLRTEFEASRTPLPPARNV